MSSLLSLLLESKVLQCGKVLVRKTAGEAEERNSTGVDLLVTVRGGGLQLERDHQEGCQGFRDDKVFH